MAGLLDIVPDLTQKLARVALIPLAEDGSVDNELGSKGLPFWPESISDTKGSVWEEKQIPGGSHPIYQWVSGTPRVITFTLVLSRDSQEVDPETESDDIHNVDVPAALAWLRAMVYPLYEHDHAKPPPSLILVLPGTEMGAAGFGNDILCIMTQCDIEYQTFFGDGTPRLVTVSVSFNEIVQASGEGGGVFFQGRDLLFDVADRHNLDPTGTGLAGPASLF